MTPSGIEPATFRFVAQRLNHCATAVADEEGGKRKKQSRTEVVFFCKTRRRAWEWNYSSSLSSVQHLMKVSCQFQAVHSIQQAKRAQLYIELEAGCVTASIWTLWREGKSRVVH